jgi:small subunit ribosomal protein S21e
MESGRQRNLQTKMKGNVNLDNKLTDLYLPRKCDYTDRLITPKDNASIQLNICDLNDDGTINLAKSTILTICGFVRSVGESDTALDKVLREKALV